MTDQKQPENVEYFTYLGNGLTIDAGCTQEFESRIIMAKAVFNKKKSFLISKMGLKFKAETSKVLLVYLKYSFVWCCKLDASKTGQK